MSDQIENSAPLLKKCESPVNTCQFSMECDRTLIKSMENILISDTIKDTTNKKHSHNMRRSVTLKDVSEFKLNRRSGTNISCDRIKIAKEKVEEAVKNGKIFAILGPYNRVRQVLRNRGWIEKFYFNNEISNNVPSHKSRLPSKTSDEKHTTSNDGDDLDDDGDDGDIDDDDNMGDGPNYSGIPPWEEEDGKYGIMSRMLKNVVPNLFWTLRKSQMDYKTLRKDQIINHHAKAGCFTTKTGLAKNLNQLRWFDDKEPDEFFPRCYTISTLEEKHAFIDDYHFTACVGLIKEVIESSISNQFMESQLITESNNLDNSTTPTPDQSSVPIGSGRSNKKILPKIRYSDKKSGSNNSISNKFLEMAIAYCEFILKIKKHEDIDRNEFIFCWSCDWDEFLNNYYKVVHEGFKIEGSQHQTTIRRCEEIANELRKIFSQFDMEGSRNIWILKPGAKSRGRGIICYSKLHDVLKLLSTSLVTNETRFIIQKYIERPLLICNTKFDIRQWFLVTDWNPLTIWWYKDCYLRFCSQQYTLDDLNEAVHLSNNSIQHKYHNGPRSTSLPSENMWDWKQFDEWLKNAGCSNAWSDIILPGMKEAVIDALLCVQDCIEWRKNSFELYGADFMVSEDLKPWLIEINSSPCMSPSTSITARLTSNVIEDVFKVILDRKENKQCDTGQFELLYKQVQINIPPYIGIDLKLAGISIKNPILSTSLINDRRASRSITESIIIRNIKRKDEKGFMRNKIKDTSISSSTILSHKDALNKSGDIKSSLLHKRSKTTIVMNNEQAKIKYVHKNILSDPKHPTSPLLQKPSNVIITSNTVSDSTEFMKTSHSPLPNIEHEEINENNNFITSTSISNSVVDDFHINSMNVTFDSNLNHINVKTKDQSLPTISKQGIISKINSSRQYKLPTKVEVVSFSMSKKVLNKSFKEPHVRKRIKQSNQINNTYNSKLFLQKYALIKSIPKFYNFYKSFNKNCTFGTLFSMINYEIQPPGKSKSTVAARINSKTMRMLSKRGDNNNNIFLLDLSTPITW